MEEIEEDLFPTRCRACAQIQECSQKMISMFEKDISEMFTKCTSLEITLNDSLPSHICFECFGHLSNFNKFRENCLNSDTFLRKQIITESIKVEPVVDMPRIKCEENESSRDIEVDFYEAEYIDEDFSQYDPESVVEITPVTDVTPTNDSKSNTFDGTKYICDYCDQQFDKKSHIGSHMIIHKRESSQQLACTVDGCAKVFANKKSLNKHRLRIHKIKAEPRVKTSTKQLKLCCHLCPKWFTVQYQLDAHIRKHDGLKPYKCPHCDKEFCKSRSYIHHLRYRHSTVENEKHRCSYDGCDKEYTLSDSLKIHFKRAHLGIMPERKNEKLICEQCGREFANGFNLKEHSYSHSGILPFACKICPKKFISNYKLKIHTMRHLNVKPFVCPTCGIRKTTNKELQAHLNFHSKEITYPCKECTRVFPSYGAINRHIRIHHRNHKPYICPHCQRAFAKAETMKNHVMTHTGEKPFACSQCGHRFIQSVALKAHMKVHAKKINGFLIG